MYSLEFLSFTMANQQVSQPVFGVTAGCNYRDLRAKLINALA